MSPTTISTVLASSVLSLFFVYSFCQYLGFYPMLPLAELIWNILVYLTPEGLISFLHPAYRPFEGNSTEQAKSASRNRAKKSEALRKIMGLGGLRIPKAAHWTQGPQQPGTMAVMSRRSPPGLGNWDNSCYQNSILQGLASLCYLPAYLNQGTTAEDESSTASALKSLVQRLNEPSNAGKMFWTPPDLKNMSSWQQQDAQEYFSKVLDEVDKEISQTAVASPHNVGLSALVELESGKNISQSGQTSPTGTTKLHGLPDELRALMARNPLEGLLAQRVGCLQCGYVEGLSLIPFNCLTVPLGRQWLYDVRTCLDDYCSLEAINGVDCNKCTLLRTKQQLEKLLEEFKLPVIADDPLPISIIPEALKGTLLERLGNVMAALDDQDFSDATLKKCEISAKNRISTTKSRQAVIARAPKSMVIHVNRSVFDEMTGAQRKNPAGVRFPESLDISSWCLGSDPILDEDKTIVERWKLKPDTSMLSPEIRDSPFELQKWYRLRAVITHYGRHENGHYICYRKYPTIVEEEQKDSAETWWRLSDDEVSEVTEDFVLSQSGVFMLFYEMEERTQPLETGDDGQKAVQTGNPIEMQPEKGIDAPESDVLVPLPVPIENRTSAQEEQGDMAAKAQSAELRSDTQSGSSISAGATTAAAPVLPFLAPDSQELIPTDSPRMLSPGATETSSPPSPLTSTQAPAREPDSCLRTEEVAKDYRQATHTMRTAPPRGSVGGGNNGMGQVSAMVSAN